MITNSDIFQKKLPYYISRHRCGDTRDIATVILAHDDSPRTMRAKVWQALDPQPPPNKVVVLLRSHSTLKDMANYKRRISWIEKGLPEVPSRNLAIVEYIGQEPSR